MTPERLAEIRATFNTWHEGRVVVNPSPLIDAVPDLLDHIDELTRQLDDARDKAINAGIFTSTDGDESKYTHALNTETCEGCGRNLVMEYCYRCETETSTPGATSYKP